MCGHWLFCIFPVFGIRSRFPGQLTWVEAQLAFSPSLSNVMPPPTSQSGFPVWQGQRCTHTCWLFDICTLKNSWKFGRPGGVGGFENSETPGHGQGEGWSGNPRFWRTSLSRWPLIYFYFLTSLYHHKDVKIYLKLKKYY